MTNILSAAPCLYCVVVQRVFETVNTFNRAWLSNVQSAHLHRRPITEATFGRPTRMAYMKLDGLWRRTVTRCASIGQVHFRKMFTVTLNSKISPLSYGPIITVVSFIEISPHIPEIGEKNGSQSAPYVTICGLTVTFALSIPNSNQFIFVPNCTKVVNLAKFPPAVYKILCQQTCSLWSCMHAQIESPKTECLRNHNSD